MSPTLPRISNEKTETIELIVTSCGHSGRGLFWCFKSMTTKPANDKNANMQLQISNVQPRLPSCKMAVQRTEDGHGLLLFFDGERDCVRLTMGSLPTRLSTVPLSLFELTRSGFADA